MEILGNTGPFGPTGPGGHTGHTGPFGPTGHHGGSTSSQLTQDLTNYLNPVILTLNYVSFDSPKLTDEVKNGISSILSTYLTPIKINWMATPIQIVNGKRVLVKKYNLNNDISSIQGKTLYIWSLVFRRENSCELRMGVQ